MKTPLTVLSCAIFLSACDSDLNDRGGAPASAVVTHTLSVAAFGGGSVSGPGINCGNDCGEDFVEGEVLSLSATAAAGSEFIGWSGACTGAAACRVSMDGDQTVTAQFALVPPRRLSVSTLGAGVVSSDPAGINCGGDCAEDFVNGTAVSLIPAPASGARFAGWSGACTGAGACRLTMSSDQSVSALFETIPRYRLNVSKAGQGEVVSDIAGINCGQDCSEDYTENSLVTLSASAASGFRFAGWMGACTGMTCRLTMSAAHTVGALFQIVRHVLDVRVAEGAGRVTSAPAGINCDTACQSEFDHGTPVTLTAVAADGFRFNGWDGACTGTAACQATMNAAQTVRARFAAVPTHKLDVSLSGDGTVRSAPTGIACPGDCEENYSENTQVTLNAIPGTGQRFKQWTGACTSTPCRVTMSEPRSVTAVFEPIPLYRLSVTRLGSGGTVRSTAPDNGINCGSVCEKNYEEDTPVTLTAQPAAGHNFVGWSNGPCAGMGDCSITMDADKSVTAEFLADVPPVSCHAVDDLSVAAAPPAGPDLLRLPPPEVAILRHCKGALPCPFKAAPLMVSGHEKYEAGEYIYQDYVFDDFGAETTGGPYTTAFITSPASGNATPDAANFRTGDISYPSDTARFGDNAADLVELRIVPTTTEIIYRVTLNTLLARDTTMVAIAWNRGDANAGVTTLPRNAGATLAGTDEIIYLWNRADGTGGEHVSHSGAMGATLTPTNLTVEVDTDSNQMTARVPRAIHNPTGTAWKYVVMTGLHNGSGTWVRPAQNASATTPGGAAQASSNPPAIFDINNHYEVDNKQVMEAPLKTGELCHYLDTPCDTVQAIALRQVNGFATPSLTAFARQVKFGELAAGTASNSLPAEGDANPDRKSLVRLFASRIKTTPAEGHERAAGEGNASASGSSLGGVPTSDRVFFYGPLQAYSIYVPKDYRANRADRPAPLTPLTWSNHSLAQFHVQYNGTDFVQEAGEKRGSLVVTPNSRSADGFYVGRNEIDHFEVWADVLRNYTVDPAKVAMTGYSMGGYATYRLATLWPDLFTKAFSVVGPPGAGVWKGTGGVGSGTDEGEQEEFYTLTNYWLENARNVPFFNMAMQTDYLVPIAGPRQQNIGNTSAGDQSFEALGYRYTYQEFQSGEHLTLFANDSYPMVKDFLGSEARDPNPAHVSFAYVPDSDFNHTGTDGTPISLKHDHAYWVSRLLLRNAADEPAPQSKSAKGTIDARSLGFGQAEPVAAPQATTPGTLAGGNVSPALAYTEYKKTWTAPLAVPAENKLVLKLTNLAAVHIDLARAALSGGAELVIDSTSDGATMLNLAGAFPDYATLKVTEDGAALCAAKLGPQGAQIPVKSGTHIYRIKAP